MSTLQYDRALRRNVETVESPLLSAPRENSPARGRLSLVSLLYLVLLIPGGLLFLAAFSIGTAQAA